MATQARKEAPDLSGIKLLGAMCFDNDTDFAKHADAALYQKIIIPLCDDFSSHGAHVVGLILASLILQSANHTQDRTQDILSHNNLGSEPLLLARLKRIQHNVALSTSHKQQLKKICILSRVTIGADLSITSVIIQRLHHFFPDIPITLIGPGHMEQLFHQPYLSHRLFEFNREAVNSSRIGRWHKLRQIIDEEQADLTESEFLLVDPDTRLSQLGLLPLAPEKSTRILPSRLDQVKGYSLSTITNRWMDEVLGEIATAHPAFDNTANTRLATNDLFTISINFGVGQDQNKRISLLFEQELILTLLRIGTTKVILDSGKGEMELAQAKAIETYVLEHQPESANSLLRIKESIKDLACHIKKAHLFIGYDSCSGHIATTCGTPAIICFKGAPNPRFYARWQPQNRFGVTTCLEVPQKQLNESQRSLLIRRIIAIASSHYQSFT